MKPSRRLGPPIDNFKRYHLISLDIPWFVPVITNCVPDITLTDTLDGDLAATSEGNSDGFASQHGAYSNEVRWINRPPYNYLSYSDDRSYKRFELRSCRVVLPTLTYRSRPTEVISFILFYLFRMYL